MAETDIDKMVEEALANAPHIPFSNDAFELARALLFVLAKREGNGIIDEVVKEIGARADRWEADEDPDTRADAGELRKFADPAEWEAFKRYVDEERAKG